MTLYLKEIIVPDRFRKDFGDIEELAEDIRQNGLISPIVVNQNNILLAGERRYRAVKSLGWEKVEVHVMETRDDEHELNIELSENDMRKEFSKAERVKLMQRLLEIEKAKAKERMEAGKEVDPRQNFAEGSPGKASEKTAEEFGVSRETMRKEIAIVEGKELLDPADFAEWDEGKLSTNKVYQKLKAELQKLKEDQESKTTREKFEIQKAERLQKENESLKEHVKELEEREPEVIERQVEVVPDDYESLKGQVESLTTETRHTKIDLQREKETVDKKQKKILELEDQIRELQKSTMEGLDETNLSGNLVYFCSVCNNFISNVGGLVWLTDRIADMKKDERDMFLKAAYSFRDWASAFSMNLERSVYEQSNRIPQE